MELISWHDNTVQNTEKIIFKLQHFIDVLLVETLNTTVNIFVQDRSAWSNWRPADQVRSRAHLLPGPRTYLLICYNYYKLIYFLYCERSEKNIVPCLLLYVHPVQQKSSGRNILSPKPEVTWRWRRRTAGDIIRVVNNLLVFVRMWLFSKFHLMQFLWQMSITKRHQYLF
jgi:hypothetical protein